MTPPDPLAAGAPVTASPDDVVRACAEAVHAHFFAQIFNAAGPVTTGHNITADDIAAALRPILAPLAEKATLWDGLACRDSETADGLRRALTFSSSCLSGIHYLARSVTETKPDMDAARVAETVDHIRQTAREGWEHSSAALAARAPTPGARDHE